MIVLSGGDLVLPDRILSAATLVIDAGRIVEIRKTNPEKRRKKNVKTNKKETIM